MHLYQKRGVLINVLDAMPLPLQFSTQPRFDTAEGLDSSTQYFAESSTTDLVSSMMDTETNFDWVSLLFLKFGSTNSHSICICPDELLKRDSGIAISRPFQGILCQLACETLVHLPLSDELAQWCWL
jgi:hypothetical protein